MVASFTDAWIETGTAAPTAFMAWSHPLRMRGLKPIWSQQRTWRKESHPLRMRGLKHSPFRCHLVQVTSHPLRMRGLKPYVRYKKP